MANNPIVSNSYLSNNNDLRPRATVVTSEGHETPIQHVIIDDGTGTAATLSSIGASGLTPQTPTQTNGSVSSAATILAANATRKGGYIQAKWGNTDNIYLSLNTPATSSDIPLAPGGVFNLTLHFGGPPITNVIYGIAGSGTQSYVIVEA